MLNADSLQYALENTRVVLAPERRIETFGAIDFRFYLVSELMDRVHQVRIRDGTIHAERPQIMTAAHCARLMLEGFGDRARDFADSVERQNLGFLKYGFQMRKSGVVESVVTSPVEEVLERVRDEVTSSGHSQTAVLQGVDDAWEVCLLKFTVELVQQSAGTNLEDLRKRGLL